MSAPATFCLALATVLLNFWNLPSDPSEEASVDVLLRFTSAVASTVMPPALDVAVPASVAVVVVSDWLTAIAIPAELPPTSLAAAETVMSAVVLASSLIDPAVTVVSAPVSTTTVESSLPHAKVMSTGLFWACEVALTLSAESPLALRLTLVPAVTWEVPPTAVRASLSTVPHAADNSIWSVVGLAAEFAAEPSVTLPVP